MDERAKIGSFSKIRPNSVSSHRALHILPAFFEPIVIGFFPPLSIQRISRETSVYESNRSVLRMKDEPYE